MPVSIPDTGKFGQAGEVKVLIVNTSLLFLNTFIIIFEREYETHGILLILCLQAENSPIEINQYNQISYGKLQRTS